MSFPKPDIAAESKEKCSSQKMLTKKRIWKESEKKQAQASFLCEFFTAYSARPLGAAKWLRNFTEWELQPRDLYHLVKKVLLKGERAAMKKKKKKQKVVSVERMEW